MEVEERRGGDYARGRREEGVKAAGRRRGLLVELGVQLGRVESDPTRPD